MGKEKGSGKVGKMCILSNIPPKIVAFLLQLGCVSNVHACLLVSPWTCIRFIIETYRATRAVV